MVKRKDNPYTKKTLYDLVEQIPFVGLPARKLLERKGGIMKKRGAFGLILVAVVVVIIIIWAWSHYEHNEQKMDSYDKITNTHGNNSPAIQDSPNTTVIYGLTEQNDPNTKHKIRSFFKSYFPREVLQKIDAGEEEISVLVSEPTILKLKDLSTTYPNFLSFQEYPPRLVNPQYYSSPSYSAQIEIPGFIKELDPKSGLYKCCIFPKPALIGKGN